MISCFPRHIFAVSFTSMLQVGLGDVFIIALILREQIRWWEIQSAISAGVMVGECF